MTRIFGIFAFLAVALAQPAAAEPATILGAFGNWTAYSTGSGSSLNCYALSEPRASKPKGAKRGKAYLILTDWPARRVKAEAQIVYGYQAKDGGPASLGVGPDKFTFFARNTGKDGSAWLTALTDTPRLVDALRGGVLAVAGGTSARGTKTADTYSLSGFNDALAKIHAVCQM